jgi:predicted nucleic acid-binding protein
MEQIVVDSNLLVAAFLESDAFHEKSQQYINGLENGDYIFHLSMLVVVEVMGVIARQPQRNRLALLARVEKSLSEWERDGRILLYPLDRNRMNIALNIAQQYRLRGMDAVIAALAEELDLPLITFDTELQQRFQRASV